MNSSFGKLIVRSLAFIGGGLLLLGIVLLILAKAGVVADGPVVLMWLILGSAIAIAAIVMLMMQDRENARRFASAAAAASDIAEGRPTGFEADDELKSSLHSIRNYLSQNAKALETLSRDGRLSGFSPAGPEDRLGNAIALLATRFSANDQSDEAFAQLERSLLRLSADLSGVASGDLSLRSESRVEAMEEVTAAFNLLTGNLSATVGRLRKASDAAASVSGSITEAAEQVARGSNAQASQSARTRTALDSLAAEMRRIAEAAERSAGIANTVFGNSRSGAASAANNISATEAIRKQVQETAKRVKRLGERSQEIGQIVSQIDDLSDRTSVLALNASLQNGMQNSGGGSISTVAEEIERLADRSTRMTQQIASMTQAINLETKELVTSMEETVRQVSLGSVSAERSARSLFEIEKSTQELTSLLTDLLNSTRGQSSNAEAAAASVKEICDVADLVRMSSAQFSEHLGHLARSVSDVQLAVSPFKLPVPELRREAPQTPQDNRFVN
ncbi:MAG: methyl-accepting chemotaxis protein [Acidobacteria bacterium]|nr:methyl-accepting chemotaxis protein [Acidobacteriota bacterium]